MLGFYSLGMEHKLEFLEIAFKFSNRAVTWIGVVQKWRELLEFRKNHLFTQMFLKSERIEHYEKGENLVKLS